MFFPRALAAYAASCITLSAITVSATTLVAFWSPGRLLIGADSNMITSAPGVIGTACKISRDGPSVYAFSGLVEDRSAGYDIERLAHEAVQGAGDLSIHLNHFLELTRDPLSRAVAALKNDSPDQYAYLQRNHPVLQAIFADVESGPPELGVAGFSLAPDGNLIDFTRVIARGDDGRGSRIVYAGQQAHLKEYLREHGDWGSADPAQLIRNLIQSEIDASRGEVGGAIDIMAVEPDGAHWVQRKPQCR